MCGCEFILELSDRTQEFGIKAQIVCIRQLWRSRRSENSSRIFCEFLPCVCDFEMTVNSVRVTTHILCVLLFFGTCRALLCPTRLSLFLSWRNLSSSYFVFLLFALAFFFFFLLLYYSMLSLILTLWLECKIREFRRRSEREMHTQKIHFHFYFTSSQHCDATFWDFIFLLFCLCIQNTFFMPSYVAFLLLTLNF